MDPLDPLILDGGEVQDPDLDFQNPSFYCLIPENETTVGVGLEELPMEMKTTDLEETQQTYCAVCGDPFSHLIIKREVMEESPFPSSYKWTKEECDIFQWITRSFQLKLARKLLWHTEEDAFPFCVACKFELQFLLDLQRKLEEVSNALRNGIIDLKQKMGSREEVFANSRIYEIDKRYEKFRSQIIQRTKGRPSTLKLKRRPTLTTKPSSSEQILDLMDLDPLVNDSFLDPLESEILTTSNMRTTRSGRKSKPVSRFNYFEDKTEFPSPVVLLSSEDKTVADQHKQKNEANLSVRLDNTNSLIVEADAENSGGKSSTKGIKRTKRNSIASKGLTTTSFYENGDADHEAFELHDDLDEPRRKSKRRKRKKMTSKVKNDAVEYGSDSDPDFALDDGDNELSSDYPDTDEDREEFVEKIVSDMAENPLKNERVVFDPVTNTVTFKDVLFLTTEDNQYKCDKCSEMFPKGTRSTLFRYHVIRKHLDCLKCKVCGRTFPTFARYVSHVKSKHAKHKMPRRPKGTAKPSRPKSQGLKTKVSEEELICPICQKPTRSRYQLEIHRWSHYSSQEKAELKAQGKLSKAVRAHLKMLQCDECGMRFKTRAALDRHIQGSHSKEESNEANGGQLCPHCGNSYMDLKKHIMRSHPKEQGEIKEFECGICGKVFFTASGRRVHKQEVHMQLCTYICTVCPGKRGFASKFKYNQHMNAHMGIRPYQCNHCQSAFTVKNHLIRHNKIFHEEGGTPKRPAYIRGMTKKGKEKSKTQSCDDGNLQTVSKDEVLYSSSAAATSSVNLSMSNDAGTDQQLIATSFS